MKKNYIFKLLLLMIPVSAFLLMSSSAGRTQDFRTGSPGDSGNTCATCHDGGSFGTSLSITDDIPSGGYDLNTSYNITVTNTSSASKNGFQVTAEKTSDNSKVGSFTAGSGSQAFNNDNHLTHTVTGNNQDSWTFTWTSPSTDQGTIKFYAAAVAADGTGGTSGDEVVTASTSEYVLGTSEANRLDFDMFPNPASEELTIQLPSGSENASVEFYDYIGRLALTQKVSQTNNSINVQDLSAGVYILKVLSDNKIGTQKFIKK